MSGSTRKQIIVAAIAMVFIGMAFSGMSGLAFENETGERATVVEKELTMLDWQQPLSTTIPTEKSIPDLDSNALNSEGGIEQKAVPLSEGFETYTAGLPPDDPPWGIAVEPDTDETWEEWFETSTLGEDPDPTIWSTIDAGWDGSFFSEDWEDYLVGSSPSGEWWFNTYGDATIQATAPPAGGPAGSTMSMHFDEGVAGDDYSLFAADNFGPATGYTQAQIDMWIYTGPDQTNDAALDLRFYGSTGSLAFLLWFMADPSGTAPGTANVVYLDDYVNGGGLYIGPEIFDDTWYQLHIEYDTTAHTYQYQLNGGAVQGPYIWYDPSIADDIQYCQILGYDDPDTGLALPANHHIDDVRHYVPVAGGTEDIYVTDTWSFAGDGGTQSVYMDQNNEPNQASTTAALPAKYYGDEVDVWFMAKTDTVASSSGATFYGIDWSGNHIIGIRFNSGNIQYYTSGTWTTLTTYTDDTEYFIEILYNDLLGEYTTIFIGTSTFNLNTPLGEAGAGLAAFRMEGTPGTQSRIWMDFLGIWTPMAGSIIEVDNTVAHSGTQSLHFLERGADTYSYFGTGVGGAVNESVGELSLWFYTGEPQGGMDIYIWDSTGSVLMTLISLGTDLGAGIHPGEVQFVDNDGTGMWIVHGPTFAPNTWNKLGINYDCTAGTFTAVWNDVEFGTYGMYGNATDMTYIEFYGGAPDVPADFYYDDIALYIPGPPEAHTGLTVDQWGEILGGSTTEPRYMRGIVDEARAGAYLLGTAQTTNGQNTPSFGNRINVYVGIRVFSRTSAGGETEITSGTPVAQASRTKNGAGLTSATWACPGASLATTDSVVVRVYVGDTAAMGDYIVEFDTGALGASQLDASTWTVWYYMSMAQGDSWFGWGDATYDSRVENFAWSSPNLPASTDHNTLNWTHMGAGVDTYNIYRSDVEAGPWDATTLIDSVPVGTNAYTDVNRGLADATLWWYVVRAENEFGEEANTKAVQEGGTPETAYDIDLTGRVAGDWAFVSFPIAISGDIQTILNDPGTTWDVAKGWDNQNKRWTTYRAGYATTLSTVNNQMGIWIHLTAVSGDKLTTSLTGVYPAVAVDITLYAGWNMVGYPSATGRTADVALSGTGATIVSVFIAASPYVQDYTNLASVTMTHGNAYWVWVPATTTWNVPL